MDDSRPVTVLLVEDHDAFALTLATVLGSDPRIEVVDRAADGGPGVELALRHRPDVVLMDIYMPTMDGIEATRRITKQLRDTVVVILSSSDSDADRARSLEAGASGFLPKDAPLHELVEAIVSRTGPIAPRARASRRPWRPLLRRLCL